MEETILKAMKRTEAPKTVRKAGFIPGVLNESDTTSTSVQFETTVLNKIISKHGPNAKIWINIDGKKEFGFIKEIQRHPVEGKVIHISVQLVKMDQEIKMHIPIAFHGRDELEHKFLQLQVYKSEVEVTGKASSMPDTIVADITKKELGDDITVVDFHFPKEIKILDAADEIYAVIKAVKEEIVEEVAEVKAPEEVKAAE